MDFAEVLEDPARARALFVWNMNPVASCPQQARLRRAFEREDLLTIALDLFPTDSTALADYVLPAASFLEFDDLIASYFHLTLSAQAKVMPPCGEALPNQEIFRRLARAMDFSEPPLRESDAGMLSTLLARSRLGEDFESLKAKGTIWIPSETAVQFADRVFDTPSGRIEIASAGAEADGLPRLAQCLCEPRPQAGLLRLLTPANAWLLNTSFGNVGRIRARLGPASIALHPADAAERHLAEGDTALVHNASGRLELRVTTSDQMPRGVALAHKGRWLATDPAQANVNALNPGDKSDMGESSAVHSVQVAVQRVSQVAVPR
jgi:anaerobic selenocysteine-containing dehydrogenase